MKLRRNFARAMVAVSAGAMGLGTLVAVGAPAQAATGTLSATPSVVVDQAYEYVSWSATVPWSSPGTAYQMCSITLENVDSRNFVDLTVPDNQGPSTLHGTFKVYGFELTGETSNFHVFTDGDSCPLKASVPVTIKWASRTSISAKRSGKYVTVSGTSTRFNGTEYVAQRATLSIQQDVAGLWKTVKTGKANSAGVLSVKLLRPSAAPWRVVSAPTAISVGASSTKLKR